MNFHQNKRVWIALAIFSPLLLIWGYSELKTMTSVYKQDYGNGVVVYADKYVNTGRWVFDCEYSRLISREPLPVPLSELESAGKLTIGKAFFLKDSDKEPAKEALRAITGIRDWYKNLRYRYSALDENSDLNSHEFHLLAQHAGRTWAVVVDQSISYYGKSSFSVTAEPYDPKTYVDYAKALHAAAKSCPVPQ
ncbi:hypothetical protein [Pseudomonas chlororaphis]|uniref:Uncharacterized protein n=1 Tax=Pseudomonas chlororaphis subsp. aurantiaca TaxID=86192 RepID=A0AAJ0ZHW0_9PSED|nr:hypothetical protein [Pseudomonas chlororaphis]MBU4632875.1 hypothetical protein [Pseudomonas chlororaphis subsp. aurantiaca]